MTTPNLLPPATEQDGRAARVEVVGVSKSYPGVRALVDFDLAIAPGEVRALLGKNGAGKSTLVRMLSGAEQPDSGQILIDGNAVEISSPARARQLGVATVHQELSLVPELSVADNLFLGRWREAGTVGPLLRNGEILSQAGELLKSLDLRIDPRQKAGELSVAAQQSVEIARAVSLGSRVLILDEPTSSLPAAEVRALLALVRRLAESGISIIYVSHRMDEIPQIAHSVTIVRDGQLVATRPIAEANTDEIILLMTGGVLQQHHEHNRTRSDQEVVLSLRDVTSGDRLGPLNLDIGAGEIVGIAGLLGSGRTELLRCLFGLDPITAGKITLRGRDYNPRTPLQAIRAGFGFTPEERKRDGLVLGMSVSENLVLAVLRRLTRGGMLSRGQERRLAESARDRLSVKTGSLRTVVGTLSGGNQQKVILGKWLNAGVQILLLDEPTRGVDVEAKDQIYGLIRELADRGVSVLLVSSETEELFLVCDRIAVMNNGRIVVDRPVDEITPTAALAIAMEGSL